MGCECKQPDYQCGVSSLKNEMIQDIASIENDLGNLTFTWKGDAYECIASITEFQRDLGDGGFNIEKLVTIISPLQDTEGNITFAFGMPDAQDVITFQAVVYRIITKKIHPTLAYVKYVARSDTRGI